MWAWRNWNTGVRSPYVLLGTDNVTTWALKALSPSVCKCAPEYIRRLCTGQRNRRRLYGPGMGITARLCVATPMLLSPSKAPIE